MANKVKITNEQGTQVFPITHVSAVIDNNGNSVEQVLGAQTDLINQKQLEIGAVESDLMPTEGSSHWVTSGGVYSVVKPLEDITGVRTVLGTYDGTDYTLTNGFINGDGEATVPSNNDWRMTSDFQSIPNGATHISFDDCCSYYRVANIAFYSSDSESSFISAVVNDTATSRVGFWDYPITAIPAGALYYKLSFVVKIGNTSYNVNTQKYSFYKITTIDVLVNGMYENIGTSYQDKTIEITKTVQGRSAVNFENLNIKSGGSVSVAHTGNNTVDIYYTGSRNWDSSNYATIGTDVSQNLYPYTFTENAGCIRVYNDNTSKIDVTISFKRTKFAKDQIEVNSDIVDRISSRIGGTDDYFSQTINFREPVTGSVAKLWTSSTLSNASEEKEWLVIMCHGNGVLIDTYNIPSTALDYFRANKINVATIQYQDLNNTGIVGAGFNKYAWGNDSQFAHVICLYNYLQSHYNFHKSVVLAGCSMGGLVMGAFAYKKPFPIAFCLGIGPVPSLMTFWTNGNESRKAAIRAAYDMPTDGSDDANAATYFQGHDWWNMGMFTVDNVNYKIGFPNVYLYYGNDSTFRDLFGGTAKYNELCQALKNGGIYSKVEQVGANNTVHDTPTVWTQSVTENVWHNELGVSSYAE